MIFKLNHPVCSSRANGVDERTKGPPRKVKNMLISSRKAAHPKLFFVQYSHAMVSVNSYTDKTATLVSSQRTTTTSLLQNFNPNYHPPKQGRGGALTIPRCLLVERKKGFFLFLFNDILNNAVNYNRSLEGTKKKVLNIRKEKRVKKRKRIFSSWEKEPCGDPRKFASQGVEG